MKRTDMAALMNAVFRDEIQALREAGQAEYAGGEDAFGNFARLGAMLGLPREKVLLVYAVKHLDGIVAWVNGHRSQREDVRGRINDLIVYLFLLRGMIEEGDAVAQPKAKLQFPADQEDEPLAQREPAAQLAQSVPPAPFGLRVWYVVGGLLPDGLTTLEPDVALPNVRAWAYYVDPAGGISLESAWAGGRQIQASDSPDVSQERLADLVATGLAQLADRVRRRAGQA